MIVYHNVVIGCGMFCYSKNMFNFIYPAFIYQLISQTFTKTLMLYTVPHSTSTAFSYEVLVFFQIFLRSWGRWGVQRIKNFI
jgi:hypothetical protein